MSWSGYAEGEHEGTHKYLIQSRLWQPVRVKGWRHNRRKRVTHELMLHAHRPRHLEGLEKSTLGAHRVHTGLLPWSRNFLCGPGRSSVPFSSCLYCLMHSRGSICSETVLSSALHKIDGNTISSGNILCIYYFQ